MKNVRTLLVAAVLAACSPEAEEVGPSAPTAQAGAAASSAAVEAEPETLGADASSGATAPAAERSCREERGEDAAQELVDRCLSVSPATRPPCNADNPCALIEGEIARSCDLLGGQGPGFCGTH